MYWSWKSIYWWWWCWLRVYEGQNKNHQPGCSVYILCCGGSRWPACDWLESPEPHQSCSPSRHRGEINSRHLVDSGDTQSCCTNFAYIVHVHFWQRSTGDGEWSNLSLYLCGRIHDSLQDCYNIINNELKISRSRSEHWRLCMRLE